MRTIILTNQQNAPSGIGQTFNTMVVLSTKPYYLKAMRVYMLSPGGYANSIQAKLDIPRYMPAAISSPYDSNTSAILVDKYKDWVGSIYINGGEELKLDTFLNSTGGIVLTTISFDIEEIEPINVNFYNRRTHN